MEGLDGNGEEGKNKIVNEAKGVKEVKGLLGG